MKTPREFADDLAAIALPSVFNPYSDLCPLHDKADAPRVRKRNLVRCLESAIAVRADTMWIARDLGYRGGRRTGIPLTDEAHLADASVLYCGVNLGKATRGPLVAERTAAVIWALLARIKQPVVLWNIFPFHPHEDNDPLSNRCHSRAERETTWPLLLALIEMIQPRHIIAIGRDAGMALEGIDLPVTTIRHPSYGGQAEFTSGISTFYRLEEKRDVVNYQPAFPGVCTANSSAR